MQTFATPLRRSLTEKGLAEFVKDNAPPVCGRCGRPLKAGDYVDAFFPFDSTANLHRGCDPQPHRGCDTHPPAGPAHPCG